MGIIFFKLLSAVLFFTSFSYAKTKVEYKDTYSDDRLRTVVYTRFSPDGKFLYTSRYGQAPLVSIFSVGEEGELTRVGEYNGAAYCRGALELTISSSGRFVALACQSPGSLLLFARDPETGRLDITSYIQDGIDIEKGTLQGLRRADFSQDERFLFAAGGKAFISAEIKDGVLSLADAYKNERLQNIRGLVYDNNSHFLYVTEAQSHSLFVMKVDPETGKMSLNELLDVSGKDANGERLEMLKNTFSVSLDSDGRVLMTSGRFEGDSYFSVWEMDSNGHLVVRQTMHFGYDGLPEVTGIHYVTQSKDSSVLYVSFFFSNVVLELTRGEDGNYVVTNTLSTQVSTPAEPQLHPNQKWLYVAVEIIGAISKYIVSGLGE